MKKIISIICIVSLVLSLTFNVCATNDFENYIKYIAVVLGVPEEEMRNMFCNADSVESFISEMEENVVHLSELYYNEDYDELSLGITINTCAFSQDIGVSQQLIDSHCLLWGKYRYSKIIEYYCDAYDISDIGQYTDLMEMEPYASGNYSSISNTEWKNYFYKYANVGNIFLTKDSTTAGYRHGHVGVVQNHTSDPKMISEAIGSRDNDADEVVCRSLNTYWPNRITLNVMYPNTTLAKRESAGAQTYWYAYEDSYSYEALSKKTNMKNSDYSKLSCVGLAYRAYYFKAQYDIIPQVGNSTSMLPKHIDQSANMINKTVVEDGITILLRTEAYDHKDWGFLA